MPIYEFYCVDCHTIYNFFSRRINTAKQASCPNCGRVELDRQISLFSVSKGLTEDGDPFAGMDESKMEKVMASMAGEFENINEEDPKQMARMMRKLYDTTELNIGAGMEEAIQRMEAGDDPDKIEEDLGDVLENEDPFGMKSVKGVGDLKRKFLPPNIDEKLYDL